MKKTTRDNLIYLAVGLTIAAIVVADFFYADSRGQKMWLPSQFAVRAVYSTALLAYLAARETLRTKATLIPALCCVLTASAVHLTLIFAFRQIVSQLRGLSFSALASWEMFVVFLLVDHSVQYLQKRIQRRRKARVAITGRPAER